jgi:hypothetical protein
MHTKHHPGLFGKKTRLQLAAKPPSSDSSLQPALFSCLFRASVDLCVFLLPLHYLRTSFLSAICFSLSSVTVRRCMLRMRFVLRIINWIDRLKSKRVNILNAAS